jgi:putative membrane protein
MSFFQSLKRLAGLELKIVLGRGRWIGAASIIACIPAIYFLIYLSSLWDPGSHARALKVGLVNLDQGYAYREQMVEMGQDLISSLLQKSEFGYLPLADAEQARQKVRAGELAFAIIIPPDFSAMALPARTANEGRLEVYASAGNNHQTYLLAKKFAENLDADLNEALNRQRWKFVLSSAMAQDDLLQLRTALTRMQEGSQELSNGLRESGRASAKLQAGAARLSEEVSKFTQGASQLVQFVKGIETSLPPADDVRRMRVGAEELAAGHQEVDKALSNLYAGSFKLSQGVEKFKQDQGSGLFFSGNLNDALDPLQLGLTDLKDGLQKTQQGHKQLTTGSEALRDSVRALAYGVRDMRASVRQMSPRLPDNAQLQLLTTGAQDLAQGQGQLDAGLKQLRDGSVYLLSSTQWILNKIPSEIRLIDGSPEGLAHSVAAELKVVAPVSHVGAAMMPNVIPVALWLGASVAMFLIRGRHLPRVARTYGRAVKLLSKATVPVLLAGLQSVVVLFLMRFWFDLSVDNWGAVMALVFTSSIAFVFMLLLLVRCAGDTGKALALLLLALQISASGGVVPIELSGDFYTSLSPWLPMTWMIQGLKAAMFGAYAGDWLQPWGMTLALVGVSALLATWIGRWHHLPSKTLRPALDL